MIIYTDPQGSAEWLAARRAVVTASRFSDCRDRLKNGTPSKACIQYAMDVARERVGGTVPSVFQNAAMRTGTEQEPIARIAYETETGHVLQEVGFIATDDRKFGVSVDSLIGGDGVWECKTMVSSATLFTAMVDGDISAYRDQCIGALWLLRREWIDLSLWTPDLQKLHTIHIERDESEIHALEVDLLAFDRMVGEYEMKLRAALRGPAPVSTPAPTDLPENLFANA